MFTLTYPPLPEATTKINSVAKIVRFSYNQHDISWKVTKIFPLLENTGEGGKTDR